MEIEKASVRVTVNLTPTQHELAEQAAGTESLSDYIRRLIAEDCARQSIDWVNNANSHGGRRPRTGGRRKPTS